LANLYCCVRSLVLNPWFGGSCTEIFRNYTFIGYCTTC